MDYTANLYTHMRHESRGTKVNRLAMSKMVVVAVDLSFLFFSFLRYLLSTLMSLMVRLQCSAAVIVQVDVISCSLSTLFYLLKENYLDKKCS